ncbi:MAG: nidogen-like domain-containing protein [Bacteroidota bacterium]
MKKTLIYVLACLTAGFAGLRPFSATAADCPGQEMTAYYQEDFESGSATGWTLLMASDGGGWQVNSGQIGHHTNPGSGHWLYASDEVNNDIGTIQLLSPVWDVSAVDGRLSFQARMLFQSFMGKGKLLVSVWDGLVWVPLLEQKDDFLGEVVLDLAPFRNPALQLAFEYQDEGSWGWGFGLDEVKLEGREAQCGDNMCEEGESPESCPGDCPDLGPVHPGWIPIGQDLTGQSVAYTSFNGALSCDDCSIPVSLGFEIDFYGQKLRQVFLNSNGNLTFGAAYTEFVPQAFCLEGPEMIAPFFADVDLSLGGELSYFLDPQGHYFVATWKEVKYFGQGNTEASNTFQVILTDGSIRHVGESLLPAETNIIFQYGDMTWTTGTASGGIGGFGGHAATVGVNFGDGVICQDYGTFFKPGFTYTGNSQDLACPPNGVDHLDFRSLFFNGAEGEIALPQGLVYFSGTPAATQYHLEWQMDCLDEVDFFLIERGVDSLNFEPLATLLIEPTASAHPGGHFVFTDPDPLNGVSYYRLGQVTGRGVTDYLDTLRLQQSVGPSEEEGNFFLSRVGPNPLQETLNLYFEAKTPTKVRYLLTDMAGRQYVQGEFDAQTGSQTFPVRIPNGLASGLYVISCFSGEEKFYRNLVKE